MKKTAFATLLILALIVPVVAGAFFVIPASANFFPEQAPSLGVRISSDGWVYGTDKISRSGNVYTLTGNLDGGITVLADNIVIDGNGYTVKGTGGGSGLFLQDREKVTIKNLKIMNFQYGIKFTWAYFGNDAPKKVNTVTDNTITNNSIGVQINAFTAAYIFSNNRITDNTFGVCLSSLASSSDNVFRNNQFNGNKYSISDDSDKPNDIDTSNTVNGKPVYYWVNKHDMTVPSDAGFVALKNCSRITVQNLNLANNGHGILLSYTTNSKITGNILTSNQEGIAFRGSSNNEISKNTITASGDYGICLYNGANENTITENIIEGTGYDGIHAEGACSGNTISKNKIASSKETGIYLSTAPNTIITENNITQNKGVGISLKYDSDNVVIKANYLSQNGLGILVQILGSSITENTLINNDGWAMRLNGSQGNNKIHNNNFIDNNAGEGLQVSMPAVWSFYSLDPEILSGNGSLATRRPLKDPTLNPGNPNSWDDGKEGNYWSDYTARYPNASAKGNLGDTPFFINENNQDNYPLLTPIKSIIVDLPESSLPSTSAMPTQQPTSTLNPSPKNQTEPFPSALLASGCGAFVVVVGVAVLVYWKRHGVVMKQ